MRERRLSAHVDAWQSRGERGHIEHMCTKPHLWRARRLGEQLRPLVGVALQAGNAGRAGSSIILKRPTPKFWVPWISSFKKHIYYISP